MSRTATISTLVPVFNGARYLGAALESVLVQEEGADEVLVLDDGSTDDSAAIAGRYDGVQVVRLERHGKSAALNAGLRVARGEWIAFLDADDLWLPGKLAAQRRAIGDDPPLDAVFTHVEEFVSPELPEAVARRLVAAAQPLRGYIVTTSLLRRSLFDRVGPFDETLAVGEFIDWIARARDAGVRESVLPQTLARRRLHEGNLGRQEGFGAARLLPMLRQVLERRRAADRAASDRPAGSPDQDE